jgi:hypothetical protein
MENIFNDFPFLLARSGGRLRGLGLGGLLLEGVEDLTEHLGRLTTGEADPVRHLGC